LIPKPPEWCSTMCDQCPDGDAVEEARWALDAAWEEMALKKQERIRRQERKSLSKEDAEERAMVWIGESRKVLVECSPWRLRAEGEDS